MGPPMTRTARKREPAQVRSTPRRRLDYPNSPPSQPAEDSTAIDDHSIEGTSPSTTTTTISPPTTPRRPESICLDSADKAERQETPPPPSLDQPDMAAQQQTERQQTKPTTNNGSHRTQPKETLGPPRINDDGWKIVTRRKRVPAAHPQIPPAAFPVILKSKDFTGLGSFKQAQAIKDGIGAVDAIRQLPSGDWLIACTCRQQQGKLLGRDQLRISNRPVPIIAREPLNLVVGVVKGVPKDGDAELRKDLERAGHQVKSIQQLLTKDGRPTSSYRVAFHAQNLPASVTLGYTSHRVVPYVAPIRRCTHCQMLGHTKQECRRKSPRCGKCACNHRTNECTVEQRRCVNCSGHHSSSYLGCPEIAARRAAHELKNQHYMPFTQALQEARQKLKEGPARGFSPARPMDQPKTTLPAATPAIRKTTPPQPAATKSTPTKLPAPKRAPQPTEVMSPLPDPPTSPTQLPANSIIAANNRTTPESVWITKGRERPTRRETSSDDSQTVTAIISAIMSLLHKLAKYIPDLSQEIGNILRDHTTNQQCL